MATILDLRRDAGAQLTDLLEKVFPEQNALRWFYDTTIPALAETPYARVLRDGPLAIYDFLVESIGAHRGEYHALDMQVD